MATLKASLQVGRTSPGWTFVPLWFAATFIGALVYFVPVGLVWIVLGLDRLNDPQRAGEIALWLRVVAGILCGAACGSTIGLAQWLVLRRSFAHSERWVAATMAGYGSLGPIVLLASVFQPGWLDWAITLIVNGKLHWLARVQPDWPGSSTPPGAVSLILLGAALGAAQWLLLRGRVPQAAWWIPISIAGWALTLPFVFFPWMEFVSISFYVPVIVCALGMVWLLRRTPAARSSA